jgi:hypothetical protein
MAIFLTVAQYAAALMTIAAAVGMFVKWVVVKPVKLYIDQATAQIAPNANGGRSLNDLVTKVDDLKDLVNKHLLEHDTPK